MKNISFDNPYILLIAIPLVLITLISFFIAIRKDNKSKSVVISLVLHLVIIFVAAVAMAGTSYTRMITKTELVIVADVSYSADKSLDIVDEYAKSIKDSLPDNSEVALVCFGKDYKLVSPFGTELLSVKDSGVDNTATDISKALEYAGTLPSGIPERKTILYPFIRQEAPRYSASSQ